MRSNLVMCLVLLLILTSPVLAQEPDDERANRLLEAELLEISTGNLQQAMGVYRALRDDEDAPEAIRARALLYLARCHRKLGELDTARQLLQKLIDRNTSEREILRQARSFLAELRSREARNPDFDWIGELERNPEIQKRIFDYCMDLVKLDSNGMVSFQQLTALGTLAAPTVARMFASSRDPGHRRNLALVLLQTGHYEHLQALIGRGESISGFLRGQLLSFAVRLVSLDEQDRERFFSALGAVRLGEPGEQFAALFRLYGNASQAPARDIVVAEPLLAYMTASPDLLARLARETPEVVDVYEERLESPDVTARKTYLDVLRRVAPDRVTMDHYVRFVEHSRGNDWYLAQLMKELQASDEFGPIVAMAESPVAAPALMDWYLGEFLDSATLAQLDPDWARVLTAAAEWELLRVLAEANDGAVPEYVAFLRKRRQLSPRFDGHRYGQDYSIPQRWQLSRHTSDRGFFGSHNWIPSAAYSHGMVELLDHADPVTVRIALDGLHRSPSEVSEDVLPALKGILLRSSVTESLTLTLSIMEDRAKLDGESKRRVAAVLLEVVMARQAPLEARRLILEQSHFDLSTVDWVALISGDDPLAASVLRVPSGLFDTHPVRSWFRDQPARGREPLLTAARSSNNAELRGWRLVNLAGPAKRRLEALAEGLDDPSETVRGTAAEQILLVDSVDSIPLLDRIAEKMESYRDRVVDSLAQIAMNECLPLLTKLLDDPSATVRHHALAAIKDVQKVIASRANVKAELGVK